MKNIQAFTIAIFGVALFLAVAMGITGCAAVSTDAPSERLPPGECPAFKLESNLDTPGGADHPWLSLEFEAPAEIKSLTLLVDDGTPLPILFDLDAVPTSVDVIADGTELSYSVNWADGREAFTLSENRSTFVQVVSRQVQTAPIKLAGVAVVCK